MVRTRIKICGICRPEDAAAAAAAGADAIGLVLDSKQRRFVTPQLARQIVAALPPMVMPVGLFVDATVEEMIATAREIGLSCVQLHGHENPQLAAALAPLAVLKAVHVDPATFESELAHWKKERPGNLRGIVLDTAGAGGGSGVANDWKTVRAAQENGAFAELPPLIAAGGLTAENVADVIRLIHPWAVDVSSGVESVLREKSPAKMAGFISAVRGTA
jgi:phosphoribosylanthranilate isomerase